VGANHRVHVGSLGHEDCGDNAAHEPRSGVDHLPAAFELVAITSVLQHVPSLVSGHVFQTRQYGMRDVWTSVGKPVAVPFRSKFDPLLFGEKVELRVRRNDQGDRQTSCNPDKKSDFSHKIPELTTDSVVTAKLSQARSSNNCKSEFATRLSCQPVKAWRN